MPSITNTNNRVIVFDTTLRDGEQSPGASMDAEEKVRIALALAELGVDVIEAGFPAASPGDLLAVLKVAHALKNPTICCALARAIESDIRAAGRALLPAIQRGRGRIHTFIATSPLHMEYKLRLEPRQVLERVKESVNFARNFTDDVEWSAEDGSRSEHDFLCQCIEAAINAGATTVNIPDTVGYAMPDEFGALIAMVRNRVPNIDKAVISVHCHNDLGLAVANSLSAVTAGARQVECTINGLGERAGNAALEEIVMALRTRSDHMPYTTGVKTENIMRTSRLVSAITGFVVQPNKAIVGANAFAHEAGIHQDGMLKHAGTYEIMTPESVGLVKSTLVLGKHSGRNALGETLKKLGYNLDEATIEEIFGRFKNLADRKKGEVSEEDIVALVDDVTRKDGPIKFVALKTATTSNDGRQTASATVTVEVDGGQKSETAEGDGPVDAAFTCINLLTGINAQLKSCQSNSVTGGTDAQAVATVRVVIDGEVYNGHGIDTDTVVASVKAYLNALNKKIT